MEIDEELTLKNTDFLTFMRCGNLSKTAAEMQLSNVSVHKALHSLESALRCPLLKMNSNLIPLKVLMSLKNERKNRTRHFYYRK